MKASRLNPRKKQRGRPKVDSEQVNLRLTRELLDALDRYIKEEEPTATRPKALRLAFRDWAIHMGYLKTK